MTHSHPCQSNLRPYSTNRYHESVRRVLLNPSRQFLAVYIFLAIAPAAFAQAPVAGQGSVRSGNQKIDPGIGPLPIFEFHSGLWFNLHHFLYQQVRESAAAASSEKSDKEWGAALDFY